MDGSGYDQRPARQKGLRPPWRPGQSGNPAGRRPKGLTLAQRHIEMVGRRTLELEAARAASRNLPALTDREGWKRRFAVRVADLQANPRTAVFARLTAEREIIAELIRWETYHLKRRDDGRCAICEQDLRYDDVPYQPVEGVTVWAHGQCVARYLATVARNARDLFTEIMG